MIDLSELSGVTLRNALKATRVRMTYHNKHKDGSGNFGFVIIFDHGGVKDAGCGMTTANETWYALHGHYTTQKVVRALSFGDYSRPINSVPNEWNLKELNDYMKRFIIQNEGLDKPEKVQFS